MFASGMYTIDYPAVLSAACYYSGSHDHSLALV